MKEKIKEAFTYMSIGVSLPILMWIVVSFFDVNIHNSEGGQVHDWNAYKVLVHYSQEVQANE